MDILMTTIEDVSSQQDNSDIAEGHPYLVWCSSGWTVGMWANDFWWHVDQSFGDIDEERGDLEEVRQYGKLPLSPEW